MKSSRSESIKQCRLKAGQVLRQLRIESQMKQEDLAKKIGCSRANITQFETNGIDSIAVIISLCNALGAGFEDFLVLYASLISDHAGYVNPEKMCSLIEKEVGRICKRESLNADIFVNINKN